MGGKTWRYKHNLLMRKLRRKQKRKMLVAKKQIGSLCPDFKSRLS